MTRIQIPGTPYRVPLSRMLPGPVYACRERVGEWGIKPTPVPVRVLLKYGKGGGPRNVLVEAVNLFGLDIVAKGAWKWRPARWVRPWRGLRRVKFEQHDLWPRGKVVDNG